MQQQQQFLRFHRAITTNTKMLLYDTGSTIIIGSNTTKQICRMKPTLFIQCTQHYIYFKKKKTRKKKEETSSIFYLSNNIILKFKKLVKIKGTFH